jgi:hypothetical protein
MSAAWVRLPPGALGGVRTRRPRRARRTPHAPVVYWPARHSVTVEGRVQFSSGALDGTVRQPAERPSSNLGVCGFDSHPCYWNCVGRRWDAGRPVKPPHTARQVRFLTGALTVRSSIGRTPGSRPERRGSIPQRTTPGSGPRAPRFGDVAQLAEAAVSEAARCGFDSHRHHWMRRPGTRTGIAVRSRA